MGYIKLKNEKQNIKICAISLEFITVKQQMFQKKFKNSPIFDGILQIQEKTEVYRGDPKKKKNKQ